MGAPDFLDTNVLVYAYDDGEPRKQSISREYLRRALRGEFVISVQVLAELAVVLLYKFAVAVPPDRVLAILDAFAPIPLVQPDREIVRRAVQAHIDYQLHFFDGMIVATAERAACARILSEDFSPGQQYFGIQIENPFV